MESCQLNTEMKSTEQYFQVVVFSCQYFKYNYLPFFLNFDFWQT